MSAESIPSVPPRVAQAHVKAAACGFELSCDNATGEVLAFIAAGVPVNGRILELGTGAGVGLAWILAGLEARVDVEVLSVDPHPVGLAAEAHWPPFVEIRRADGRKVLSSGLTYDFIFADAPAGKTEGGLQTICALAQGGVVLFDDMSPRPHDVVHVALWPAIAAARELVASHDDLRSLDLAIGSGLFMARRIRHSG